MILPRLFSPAINSSTKTGTPVFTFCLALLAALMPIFGLSGVADAMTSNTLICGSGQTVTVSQTTHLRVLTIAQGCTLTAPAGYSLTLTVNGNETGQAITTTGGADTALLPGTYHGNIVLTVAEANPIAWQGLIFPFRQALYVDSTGIVNEESVLASVLGGQLTTSSARNFSITSTGEAFNGVYVAGGDYTLDRPTIALTGNGRSDFVGYGAAIVGTGTDTRLVIDNAHIANTGAVRTGIVADNGANVIVKNSSIQTQDGILPADYQPTVDLEYMESAPWMLSIAGNVRATNLLGVDTKATYINSSIASEGWGVLSTDSGQDGQLTAIDSHIANTGTEGGYGSYAIGNATERFLGDQFNVATYATINRGGSVYYGDSTHAAIAALNTALGLGLTAQEIASLPVRPTIIHSQRFGMMWHGAGSVAIDGGTVINSKEATFLDKGQQVTIDVNGAQGAQLHPANGILLQIMENDDPGPVFVNGKLVNAGVYTEPTGLPAKDDSFDVTATHNTDAVATFSDTSLNGNFYNGIRGDENMALTFNNTHITGTISATETHHAVSTITSANYQQLGEVTNTVSPIINNGVIVNLNSGSRWTVNGTSYLSKLTIAANASVAAPFGHTLTMTVDGVPTPLIPGHTYTGSIILTVHPL